MSHERYLSRHFRKGRSNWRGFTLVELLVVIATISLSMRTLP
ncbi:MAG: prepilin-type N-terminal cleavage/methylation domain-containing protein [Planctomycetota bacterium]|nr:MAG: prepilin-type N-terminal cleavage/methylation domain-containing protein [Planctomycetota bacterium]